MSLIETIFRTNVQYVKPTLSGFLFDKRYDSLDFHIHGFSFMRKLFNGSTMACYSMDAQTGKDGHHCCLCDWNYRCTKIIRLRIMLQNTSIPTPALLDVNDHSFPSIEKIIEDISPQDLHKTLITATINTDNRLKIDFTARF